MFRFIRHRDTAGKYCNPASHTLRMQLRSECTVFAFCTTRDYGDSCCSIKVSNNVLIKVTLSRQWHCKMPVDCTTTTRSSDNDLHLLFIHSTETHLNSRAAGRCHF